MTTAYAFLLINFVGYILALVSGPFWGLIAYANIYFNTPDPDINWWAAYLPITRWSFLTTIVMMVSFVIHWRSVAENRLRSIHWAFIFLLITTMITYTIAFDKTEAIRHNIMLLSYCITVFCIVKSIRKEWQFRLFILFILAMATKLSLYAHLYGRRIHARLENIGTADTFGSNEFALLLAAIIPLTIPFIIKGKKYERMLCLLSLPFMFNAFILCNSRGAFVSMVLSLIVVFLFMADAKIRKVILVSSICAGALLVYLSDEYFIERLSSLLRTEDAMSSRMEANELSSGRIEVWRYGLKMVEDHPFGAGPNGFKQLARLYMPEEMLTFHAGMNYGIRAAHSTYLQVLVEQGYLGLLVFMIICLYTLYLLYAAFKQVRQRSEVDQFWKYTIFAQCISFCSILFGGLFNSRIYYEFFWWQIALSVVAYSFAMKFMYEAAEPIRSSSIPG